MMGPFCREHYGAANRHVARVRHGNNDLFVADERCDSFSKPYRGLSELVIHNFDRGPLYSPFVTGADRFQDRLFDSEAGGKRLFRECLTPAVGYFPGRENAIKKTVPPTAYGVPDTRDFNYIYTNAIDHIFLPGKG